MSVGRRTPSFTIYRDDPVDLPTPTLTSNMTLRSKHTQPLQPLVDKENHAPYTAPHSKAKKASKTSLASSSSSIPSSSRPALATKYVAPPKEAKRKSTSKSTSSKSTSNNNNTADPVTPARPSKLTKSQSVGGLTRKKKVIKERLASLPPLEEEVLDGLTKADRRAIELTVTPLADVTEAFVISRKRSRDLSTIDENASSSSQATLLIVPTQSTTPPGSPAKRVRLSPRADLVPLPPSPIPSPRLRAQSTLVDLEVMCHDPTLVELPPSPQ